MSTITVAGWPLRFVALVVPLMATTSWAQPDDAPDTAAASTRLGSVLVEGTIAGDISDVPGAATVLDADEIKALRPYTLHDALRYVPGVRTLDDDALGRRSGIGIRGAPTRRSRKTLLLEDGVPLNAAAYIDGSGHYTPPTQRLKAVEVLKGTGHVLYGPLNNHGIINFRPISPTRTPETTLELSGGNEGAFGRHLRHQRTDGRLGAVFSFTGMDADGSFDVERHRFDDYYTAFEFAASEHHVLGLSVTHFRERSNYDESNLTPQEYAVAPRKKRGRFGQELNSIAVDYSKLDLTHQWSQGLFTVSSRLYGTDLDRPRFTIDPGDILVSELPNFVYEDPATAFIPGQQGVMVSRSRQYRQIGGESRFVLNVPGHEWSFGVQGSRSLFDDARSFGEAGEILNEGNRGQYTGENELAASRLEKYHASAAALYVQDAVRFGDWEVTPGLRLEHYTVVKAEKFRGNTDRSDRLNDDDNTLLLPSLTVLWRGLHHTQVFAGVGRGYTPAFARTADGFPLKPETGINSQIGFRSMLGNGVSMDAAAYYNRISDTIVQRPFTIDDLQVVINAADSRSMGIDLGLHYLSLPLTERRDLRMFGALSLSVTDTEFTEGAVDGNEVPGVPGQAGTLTLGVRNGDQWQVSLSLDHVSRAFSDELNTRGLVLIDEDGAPVGPDDAISGREVLVLGELPARTLLSARASLSLPIRGPRTELFLTGRNLLDKLYISDIENGVRPGAPRTVVAGVTVTF